MGWAILVLSALWSGGSAPPAQAARPNILFILTDDQRFDAVGYRGHPFLKTPNLDRLAAEGVRFPNAFVTTPICAASRASILTGRYERKHGYTFGTPPLAGDPKQAKVLAQMRERLKALLAAARM